MEGFCTSAIWDPSGTTPTSKPTTSTSTTISIPELLGQTGRVSYAEGPRQTTWRVAYTENTGTDTCDTRHVRKVMLLM